MSADFSPGSRLSAAGPPPRLLGGVSLLRGQVYLHVADEQLPLAEFDAIAAPRLLMTAVSVFPSDHRQVVRGYFQHFGLQYDEGSDAIRATAPNGSVVLATFDDLGRIATSVSIRRSRTPARESRASRRSGTGRSPS
jgi:hypothetical protein